MRVWATSCLHLEIDDALERLNDLANDVKEFGAGDTLILLGDIAQGGVGVVPVISEFLASLKGIRYILVDGNHDDWQEFIPDTGYGWPVLIQDQRNVRYDSMSGVLSFRGWNRVGTSWAQHHPVEHPTAQDVASLVYSIKENKPKIVATHYPLFAGDLCECADPIVNAAMLAGVEKFVFGHLHKPRTWIDVPFSSDSDIQVYNVAAVGQASPFTLVHEYH